MRLAVNHVEINISITYIQFLFINNGAIRPSVPIYAYIRSLTVKLEGSMIILGITI